MFYRLTGLSEQDVKRITIFSLVQGEKLSNLYELVAEFLRQGNSQSDGNRISLCATKSNDTTSCGSSSEQNNFKTLTLPCIQFPKNLPLNHDGSQRYCLFMHVSLPPLHHFNILLFVLVLIIFTSFQNIGYIHLG